MSDRWWNYFSNHMAGEKHWLQGAVSHWQFFQTFYGVLLARYPPGTRILDVGCGPGYSDLYLAANGYCVTGVDNDERVVQLATDLGARVGVGVDYLQANAFDLSPFHDSFDVVYSVGVLEHFDRHVTVELLREQARCAHDVIICIPTRFTRYSDGITDERIYRIDQLRQIVREADLDVTGSFGFGDVTVTRSQIWLKRLLPHAAYRTLQNNGYGFNIAVIGSRRTRGTAAVLAAIAR